MRRISSVFGLAPVDLLLKQEQEWLIGADEMELIRAYRAAGLLQREIIHRVAEPSQLLGDKQAKGSKPVDLLNRSANDPFELNQ